MWWVYIKTKQNGMGEYNKKPITGREGNFQTRVVEGRWNRKISSMNVEKEAPKTNTIGIVKLIGCVNIKTKGEREGKRTWYWRANSN
jgi:hypothetical protein